MNALRSLLQSRLRLAGLLVAVFALNFLETQLEEKFKPRAVYALGYRINQTFHELEGGFDFSLTGSAEPIAVIGYSFCYFFLLPGLLVGTAIALWRRADARGFRVFALSIAINYLVALPFFLFFPVPERWAFPGAKATLLSDLLNTHLIEAVRPISGLDNCFPSTHVSLTILIVLLAYWCSMWWRHSVACLGGTIVLSTFFLGIHWIPDMVMGAASAALSFSAAVALERRLGPADAGLPKLSATRAPRPRLGGTRPPVRKTVFISYRRDRGSRLARVVQMQLERRRFSCFLDVDDLGAEHFDERLLREIENAPNTVLVLAPGSLDRCSRPDDWLRREVEHALHHNRNVVPLLADGFQFPPENDLPPTLRNLPRLNGVLYSHDYFSAAFDKLEGFLIRG